MWKVEVRPTKGETLYANAHACKALGMLLAEADRAIKTVGERGGVERCGKNLAPLHPPPFASCRTPFTLQAAEMTATDGCSPSTQSKHA